MPEVNGKHFSYTKKGKAAAKKYAKKHGKKVKARRPGISSAAMRTGEEREHAAY